MKRVLFISAITILTLAGAAWALNDTSHRYGSLSTPSGTQESISRLPELQDDNRLLHDQVSLCNLVNALWLSEQQLKDIIAVYEEHTTAIQNLERALHEASDDPGFGQAMKDLRNVLMDGEEPDTTLKDRVHGYSGRSQESRLAFEELRLSVAELIAPLLTENQLVILGEYKPCLFNVNDPFHPERVGQASGASRLIEGLRLARETHESRCGNRIEQAIARLAEKAALDTPFAVDVEAEKQRLWDVVERALAMTDEEFDAQAEELAAELTCYIEARDNLYADRYNIPTGIKDRRIVKIGQMMVIPGAHEIFQAELRERE